MLTTQQYHLMYEAGVFSDDDRLELINGEIKTMSPIGKKHVACIIRLVKLFEKSWVIVLWSHPKILSV